MTISEDPQACVIALQVMKKGAFSKTVFLVAFLSWCLIAASLGQLQSLAGCCHSAETQDDCLGTGTPRLCNATCTAVHKGPRRVSIESYLHCLFLTTSVMALVQALSS